MRLKIFMRTTIILIVSILSGAFFSQNLKVSLSHLPDSNLDDGLVINIRLVSMYSKKIKVHGKIYFNVSKDNSDLADGYFEVKANPSETDSAMEGTTDCDQVVWGKKYAFLSKNQPISYKFDLGCYYRFTKGHKYRIRFYYKLSKLNPLLKDGWSSWLLVKK